MFYLKAKDLEERTALLAHLKADDIHAVFHYVPLHSAPAGLRFSRFHGEDVFTTKESERLVRLPLWYGLDELMHARIIRSLRRFYA
jgi:dTDP-4-amino-4,6-dideoxygalactose transaminase